MVFSRMSRSGSGARWSLVLAPGLLIASLLLSVSQVGASAHSTASHFAPGPARAGTPARATALPEYVPGEIVIGWEPPRPGAPDRVPLKGLHEDRASAQWQAAEAGLAARTKLKVLDVHPNYGIARLAVGRGRELPEIDRLKKLPWVKYAELNYVVHAALVPNDPYYPLQWSLPLISAPAAWSLTQGSSAAVIALLDSGVESTHPDLTGRVLAGWNVLDGSTDTSDDFGHGTHVAGIIAAGMNNGIGVAGLAPKARLLPVKVLDWQGNGSFADIIAAIMWAADYPGMKVINLSLGGPVPCSSALQSAIDYASAHVLLVAAAGNLAAAEPPNPDFAPASCGNILAVGATDHQDRRAPYSGYKSYVDIAAPGGVSSHPLLSTLPRWKAPSGYGYEAGTSMAAPLVSAAAALAWDLWPTATPEQIMGALQDGADPVPDTEGICPYLAEHSDCFGAGRLNAARSMRYAYPPSLQPAASEVMILLGGDTVQRSTSLLIENPSERLVTWRAEVTSGGDWLSVSAGSTIPPGSTFSHPGALTLTAQARGLAPGRYRGSVRVESISGTTASFTISATLVMADSIYRRFLPLQTR